KHSTANTSSSGTLKEAIVAVLGVSGDDQATTVYGFTWNNDNYLFYNKTGTSSSTIATDDIVVKLAGTAGTTVDLDSLAVSTNDIVFA
ncbi:hypothetical protein CFT12S02855_03990, partial [Campylobacter fetus subsp. testudinum]|uniref:hypothetical protein n=1 Tax=Campylobacter fetus TaxID=196 RepID=UPI00082869D3